MKKNKKRIPKKQPKARKPSRRHIPINALLSQALNDHRKGDLERADTRYQQILKSVPLHPDALHLRGVLKSQQGDFALAVTLIEKAIQLYPNHADFYINLGNAFAHQGELEKAIASYAKAVRLNPGHPEAHHNMGNLLKRAHRFSEALTQFQAALQLKPDMPEVYNDMGNVLIDLGQLDDALACYQKALDLKPHYPVALNNFGTAYKILERYPEALQIYGRAVQQNPNYAEALTNIGATLVAMEKPGEAIAYFKKALEIKPDHDLAMVDLYYALKRTCAWEDLPNLDQQIDRVTAGALKQDRPVAEDPFLSLARHDDPEINFAIARSWSKRLSAMAPKRNTRFVFNDRRKSSEKITLGYLSKNFRNHAMAHLMAGMFEHHDRKRFNVYGYSIGEDDQSGYRQRIEAGCDRFVDIRRFDHFEAAQSIYDDNVDILIDLMGYTKGNRMEIAALRPAPVQVRFMGMAGTTGADFFDYLIADQTVVPPSQSRHYSEKLVYLPDCYQVNDSRQRICEIEFSRHEMGLPNAGFVFCSFNQLFKLDRIMFEVWMTILKQVPDSVLWLHAGPKAAEENLLKEAEACGVKAERMVFGQRMPKAEHLARLRLADLALDTRMINGAATTSDALWAGLPVITLKGSHFSSRMSASILSAIGLPELVVTSLNAYQELAVRIAEDKALLESLMKRIHDNRRSTDLFNTAKFTKNIENAYATMWRNCLEGKPPEVIRG